jgi:hypothetical protein
MPDTELESALDEARKKPRYFAIVVKGQNIVKMIVQKKRIKDGDIAYAKREFSGNGSITGVCSRKGAEFVLQVLDQEPPLKALKVKEFIALETGIPIKPRWEVVTQFGPVDDEEGQPGPPPPAPTAAPTPTPTASGRNDPTGDSPAADPKAERQKTDKIKKALKKAAPNIQRALLASPQAKAEILERVATVKKEIQRDQADAAMASLRELVEFLAASIKSGSAS